MAPKSANNMDPYSRAAFLAAQVDSLLSNKSHPASLPNPHPGEITPKNPKKRSRADAPRAAAVTDAKKLLRAATAVNSKSLAVPSARRSLPAVAGASEAAPQFVHRPPDVARHRRKCQICRHPHREAIEADFIDWCNASWIEETYNLKDQSAIYRHARATGLDVRRRQNVRMVVEKILEDVDHTTVASPSSILRAVRTLACLNDRGQWIDPPTTHHVISTTQPPAQSLHPPTITSNVSSSDSSFELPAPGIQNSNRQTSEELEIAVSDSNQTAEAISNRQTKSIFPR